MKLNKLYILGLMMLSLVIFSCKKDHPVSGQQDKVYPITFNVGGFNQSTGGFETNAVSTSALSDQIQQAYYKSYDASGNNLRNLYQRAGTPNFGTFKDSLKNGTYTIVFLASKSDLFFPEAPLSTATASLMYPRTSDMFYKKIALTVSNGKVSQNVSLDRIVANIQVNIEDQIPSNAYYFRVDFHDSYIFNFSTSTPNQPDLTSHNTTLFTLTNAQKGVSNVNFSVFALNTIAPISLDISCLDIDKNIIARKIVDNVNCRANKTTIVTGKLFGSSSGTNNSFTSKVDTAWNPSNINISF